MRLSSKVERIMQVEHITPEELAHMLKHAAITSRRGFNRRFHHWLFKMQGQALVDMQYAEEVELGTGDSRVREYHECEGQGCRACGWVGYFIRRGVRDKDLPQHESLRVNLYPSTT